MSQTLDPSSPANKQRQNNVRGWADRLGYRLHRDPGKMLQSNDFRCYQLEDVYSTTVTFGVDYDLSLHDVEAILQDEGALLGRLRAQGAQSNRGSGVIT